MSKTCMLLQLEEELTSFYDYCKDLGLNQSEIREVCSPLLHPARKRNLIAKIIAGLLVLMAALYALAQLEYFAWHFSAIARILMIKILPFYNWEKLKYAGCLIEGAAVSNKGNGGIDCYYCEITEDVAFSDDNDPEFLRRNYIDLDIPVVFKEDNYNLLKFATTDKITYADDKITAAHHKNGDSIDANHQYEFQDSTDVPPSSGPKLPSVNDLINAIIQDATFDEITPCKLATNLPVSARKSIAEVLITSGNYKKFFLHFQNCDFDAVKALRRVFPRPQHYFDEVAPVQYSWIVLSRNYGGGRFKRIQLQDTLTSFKQILGKNYVRLYPAKNCVEECGVLETYLKAGEVLYFTSLWDLEYQASDEEENLAVIFETHM